MAWDNTSWLYRKEITVSNESADYQTKVLVGESSGATGEEVDCGGKCLSSFADLRFTGADGETLLDYWIESITGTTPNQLATVWVQNNATPDTTLYMYYGNSGASSASSGANTFILFDNFERGNNGDAIGGIWTLTTGDADISTEQEWTGLAADTRSGKIMAGSTDATIDVAHTTGSGLAAYAMQMRFYKEAALAYCFSMLKGNGTKFIYPHIVGDGSILYRDDVDLKDTGVNSTNDAWNLLELRNINWTTYTFDIYLNGSLIKASAGMFSGSGTNNDIRIAVYDGNAGRDIYIDNFIVRKWAATEPSFAFGSEETIAPTVTTQAASSVEETTATGNGNITAINGGAANCTQRGFDYDTDTGAPYANEALDTGTFSTGAFTKGLTGLTKGELYYARAKAYNGIAWGYGSEVTFLTKPDEPSGFSATGGVTSGRIALAWTKGTGAQKTYIRGKVGSYPTDRADGSLIYNDTGTSYNHDGLTGGNVWYYRAWSYATEGALEQYSDVYVQDSETAITTPTVTTQAVTDEAETSVTGNGNITNAGGENCTRRGFCYKTGTSGDPTTADSVAYDDGSFSTGAYTKSITGLTVDTNYRVRAYAVNSLGTSYGTTVQTSTLWTTGHAMISAQYLSQPQIPDRVYVVGIDEDGNYVVAESTTGDGKFLQQYIDSMITTNADAQSVADNIRDKNRISANRGQIVSSPNCGLELYDVIKAQDIPANQDTDYRVAGFSLLVDFGLDYPDGKWQHTIQITSV